MLPLRIAIVLLAALLSAQGVAHARQGNAPYTISANAKRGVDVPLLTLPPIDAEVWRKHTQPNSASSNSVRNKRLAVARGHDVSLEPLREGLRESLSDGSTIWRLRVQAEGATDLRIGFGRYLPAAGISVWVIGANDYYEGPYTADDAAPLWVPTVPGDSAIIEIRVAAGASLEPDALVITHVGAGFHDLFARAVKRAGDSGACNINVACPLGQPYTNEQRALAFLEFRADDDGLTYICTGTMLADVPATRKNYLLSAAHCFSSATEAASLRVYWNYRSTQCSSNSGFSLTQNQTGSTLRATRADADFTLVELNTAPLPSWQVYFAGWDASGIAPSSSIGLHHPSGDVAKVTQSSAAPYNFDNCIGTGGTSANTHWHSGPYSQGMTEGGSSGSGLWIPSSDAGGRGKRLIGVLSGGNAQCSISNPNVPDGGFDCYGKFSAGWDGPASNSRLRDWLDPASSNSLSIGGLEAGATQPPAGALATPMAARGFARSNRTDPDYLRPPPLPFDTRTRPAR
ncbi:MAG: hypothetical protein ABI650_08110 [Dokdonella sp.]